MDSPDPKPPDSGKSRDGASHKRRSAPYRFALMCLLIYAGLGILPAVLHYRLIAGQRPDYWGQRLPVGAAVYCGLSSYLGPFCTTYYNTRIDADGDIFKAGIKYGTYLVGALVALLILNWLVGKRQRCLPLLVFTVLFVAWCITWYALGLGIAASHVM